MKNQGVFILVVFILGVAGTVTGAILGNGFVTWGSFIAIFVFVGGSVLIGRKKTEKLIEKVKKEGKPMTGKIIGAFYAGQSNAGNYAMDRKYFFFPIVEAEDIFGNKSCYTSVGYITGVELQQLKNKGEVNFKGLNGHCKIEEDFSNLPYTESAPYLGKIMCIGEHGEWTTEGIKVEFTDKGNGKRIK